MLARETTLFAVRTIDVSGAGPGVERQVERALRDRAGKSLFGLDLDAAQVDVAALPTVASVASTARIRTRCGSWSSPERPVAVVRQGADSFVVSRRGRVMARVDRRVKPDLARIWVAKDVRLDPGAFVEATSSPPSGPSRRSRASTSRAASSRSDDRRADPRLRSGLELRLGDTREVDLKLAVADRVLRVLPTGSATST